MAYQTRNLINGAAALYFSTASSDSEGWNGSVSLPDAVPTESMRDTLEKSDEWGSAGFTTEGIEVEYTPEFTDVEVDQLLDAAQIYKTRQSFTVRTTLAEATLENLQIVWAMPKEALVRYSTHSTDFEGNELVAGDEMLGIGGGSLGEYPVERSLAFVGNAPRKPGYKTERIYHVRRVLQTEASSHGLRRAESTVFPVSFRCMPDPNHPGNDYGFVKGRVFTTTGSTGDPVARDTAVDDPTTPGSEGAPVGP